MEPFQAAGGIVGTAALKKRLSVVGAAIIDGSRCLVAQRGPQMALAGQWEFPGGKVETNESPESALVREIEEELGLKVEVGRHLGRGEAATEARQIILDVYVSTIVGGALVLSEHAATRWIGPREIAALDWAEADRPILPALQRLLEGAA